MTASSRRDFVSLLLGAPLAALACREAQPRLPDGELLLPGKVAGHRLRDLAGARPEPAKDAWYDTDVAIVGAGAAGLAAAWWLNRHGLQNLLVLELDDAPGGTSRAGKSALTAHPWGAHYIVAPRADQPNLVALLDEMGALEVDGEGPHAKSAQPLVAEHITCREPEERLFYRGRWYEGLYPWAGASAADLAELARFQAEIGRWVAFRDARGRRAFTLPASAGSDAAEVTALDQISFATWLDQHELRSERLRWLMDYSCRDDYGLLARDTSAWAGIAYFAARIEAPGDDPQPVLTWPEGNARLTDAMARPLGVRLRLDAAVYDVRQSAAGVELRALQPQGVVGIRARRAILATPEHVTRRLVSELREGLRAPPPDDRGAWAVANLHLAARPRARSRDAPLSWDNVLHGSPSLGYVVATHQAGRDHGATVFTWYYPFTGDGLSARRELDGAGREDWAAVALADLSRAHPDLPEHCRRIDVAYWGHGMVRPRPGSVFHPARRAAREPLGCLHFASSELSGVSLFEEALDHGVRAASEVLEKLGRRA